MFHRIPTHHAPQRTRPMVAALIAAGLILPQTSSTAANVVWTGRAASCINWKCTDNWVGASPKELDNLIFGASAVTNSSNDLLNQIGSLTFSADARAMTLSGKTLTVTADIRNNSAFQQTINMPLLLQPGYNNLQPKLLTLDGGKGGLAIEKAETKDAALYIQNNVTISSLKKGEQSINFIYLDANSTLTTRFIGLRNQPYLPFNDSYFSLQTLGSNVTINNTEAFNFGANTKFSFSGLFNDIGSSGTNYFGENGDSSAVAYLHLYGKSTKWLSQRDFKYQANHGTNSIQDQGISIENGAYMSVKNFTYSAYMNQADLNVYDATLAVNGDLALLNTARANIRYGKVEVSGIARIGEGSTVDLNLGTLNAAQFDNQGTFRWYSGTLGFTGLGGAQLGNSMLGKDLLLDEGKSLQVSNTLTVGEGTRLTVTKGQLNTGLIAVQGGTANLSGQAAANNKVQLGRGTLLVTGSDQLNVGKLLHNTPVLDAGKTLQVAGTLNFDAGSSLSVAGGRLSAGQLQLDGGTLNIFDDSDVSGQLAFNRGTLRIAGNGSVALGKGILGQHVQLNQGATLDVSTTLSIGKGTSLVVGAGQLKAGQLALNGGTLRFSNENSPQNLQWNSGTLSLGSRNGVSLGSGALAQTSLLLDSGRKLSVDHTLSLGRNTNLILAGGQVEAGTLALQGGRVSGQLNMDNIGQLHGYGSVNGAVSGGKGARITASGGVLSLGDGNDAEGYSFGGTLDVGNSRVWIFNQGVAQLGNATLISDKGQLHSSDGLLLDAGSTLSSYGNVSIYGLFINQSNVTSNGGILSFYDDVSGTGSFTGQMLFRAGYNPGGAGTSAQVGFGGGSASYGSTAVLTMEVLAAGNDQMRDLSSLNFNGTLHLVFGADFNAKPGSSIKLFDFQNFTGQFDAEHIVVDGYDRARLDFSRLGRDGSISVSAVPEPSSYAMLLGGLGLFAWRRRRAFGLGAQASA